jgi:hypothetical protein
MVRHSSVKSEHPSKERETAQREARRMRRVPFSGLQGTPDETTVDTLVRRYRVRRETARALIGHEIREPEDLLRIPDLGRLSTAHEFWQLMTHPGFSAYLARPEPVIRSESSADKTSGTHVGFRTSAGGRTRVFIADTDGDLISAETRSEGSIDLASVRFLDYRPFQLPHLSKHQVRDFLLRLHGSIAVKGGLLWKSPDTPIPNVREPIRVLSQLLRGLQGFTYREAVQARAFTNGSSSGGTVAPPDGGIDIQPPDGTMVPPEDEDQVNGCTSSPDFDFKDCCDKHDRCYQDEDHCTSCDRVECDWELYTCIVQKGVSSGKDYTALAAIYYFAVRTAGESFFEYCDEHDPVYVTVGGLIGAAIAVAGVVIGTYLGGPVGGVIGGAVGIVIGVLVSQGLGSVLCLACEKVVAAEEDCEEYVEETRTQCRTEYEKRQERCKKKKWWKKVLCRIIAWIQRAVCEVWTFLVKVACEVVLNIIKVVVC